MSCDPFSQARRVVDEYGPVAEVEADVQAFEHRLRHDEAGERHWRQVAEIIPEMLRAARQ